MQVPLELSFRNVPEQESLETLIREKVDKLESVCDYLTSCRIAVERVQGGGRTGNPYAMRIELGVPGHSQIVVKQEKTEDQSAGPLTALVRDTFAAARRRLQEAVERQRGEVKQHLTPDRTAIVGTIFHDRGYGFLETLDRREIYFHRNSVLNDDFDRLEIGTGVRYEEIEGDKGPQATTVAIVDKPGVSTPRSREAEQ